MGSTRKALEARVGEHQAGVVKGYTRRRRPVRLVYAQEFDRVTDAIAAERQLKGWRRAKKEALIKGDMALLKYLSQGRNHDPSTSSG